MNTKIISSLIGTSLALAVAAAIWAPTNTSAQVKGAQLLIQRATPASEAPAAAPDMSCPKCSTVYSTRMDTTARGSIKPTVTTAKHLCGSDSCDTSIKTTGTGKHAVDVTVHTCGMGATTAVSCCK